MKGKVLVILSSIFFVFNATAQFGVFQQGEVGITAGVANYFGDLNPNANISHPKIDLGVYLLKDYNEYLDLRVSAHYAQLGFSDSYNNNEFQKRRNLSFNTDIWELALQGDFNFFKFIPGDPQHSFTPFISFGIGMFSYNPYAYLNGNKVFLRPLGTEGQNFGYVGPDGKARKPYGDFAVCFPIGFGLKYNLNTGIDLTFQIVERLTTTDYIDDVSTTYVGATNFPPGSVAYLMQDRSSPNIGNPGVQRGWSSQNDQYLFAEFGVSFNLRNYRCPTSF